MTKIKYTCTNCGSDKVMFPTTTVWDVESQSMVVTEVSEYVMCATCLHTTLPLEEEVE